MDIFSLMTTKQLNDWYEGRVGYRPQDDDPGMSVDELRKLVRRYAQAEKEES